MALKNKKSLGQHWLKDKAALFSIADEADILPSDTVLEIGPGLGTLTSVLLNRAQKVVAVEFDSDLARKLPAQFPGKNLEVINQDILQFDLESIPQNYKVVANVPYYITSKIIHKLMTAQNKPDIAVILVQKEVAERATVPAGKMSALSVSAQLYADVYLGDVIKADLFVPPPEVDSQVLVLKSKNPQFPAGIDDKKFFRIVKAGFIARRKKLRSSLSAGLAISKTEVEKLLAESDLSPDLRAEDLSVDDWKNIARNFYQSE